jgi:hypothetical protein
MGGEVEDKERERRRDGNWKKEKERGVRGGMCEDYNKAQRRE